MAETVHSHPPAETVLRDPMFRTLGFFLGWRWKHLGTSLLTDDHFSLLTVPCLWTFSFLTNANIAAFTKKVFAAVLLGDSPYPVITCFKWPHSFLSVFLCWHSPYKSKSVPSASGSAVSFPKWPGVKAQNYVFSYRYASSPLQSNSEKSLIKIGSLYITKWKNNILFNALFSNANYV